MRCVRVLLVALCMVVCTAQASALTVNFDADLEEWTGADVTDLGTRAAPDGGSYTLLASYDADNFYLGMDRGDTERYLGDTGWDNDSFFVAVDVDGTAASGGATGAYGIASFGGTYLPDLIYAFEGGPHWYHTFTWDGSSFVDNSDWGQSGVIYGGPTWGDDDEFALDPASIGGEDGEVRIWAWMTREGNEGGYIEASWPSGKTSIWDEQTQSATHPTFGDGVVLVPEPTTLALLGLGSLAMTLKRRRAN